MKFCFRRPCSKSIYPKKERNGPPSANHGLSTAESRHGHAVCTQQVHPPTSPCPTLSTNTELVSKGHCRSDITKLKICPWAGKECILPYCCLQQENARWGPCKPIQYYISSANKRPMPFSLKAILNIIHKNKHWNRDTTDIACWRKSKLLKICTHTCQLGSPAFALFLYSHFRKRLCHIRGLASISVQRCQDGQEQYQSRYLNSGGRGSSPTHLRFVLIPVSRR